MAVRRDAMPRPLGQSSTFTVCTSSWALTSEELGLVSAKLLHDVNNRVPFHIWCNEAWYLPKLVQASRLTRLQGNPTRSRDGHDLCDGEGLQDVVSVAYAALALQR